MSFQGTPPSPARFTADDKARIEAKAEPSLSWKKPELLRDLGVRVQSRLEHRWVQAGDLTFHSRSSRDFQPGVPFVLVHGLVISSLYMIPLAECLAVRHPVHALDLPGFGRSKGPRQTLSVPALAEAALRWMERAAIPRCHLAGNSLGCEIAVQMAVKSPDRVATLSLVGPTLDPEAHAVVKQTWRLLRDAMREPASLWLNWFFDFVRAGIRRALETTREMFRNHIEEQLPQVTAPTLIIRGGIDPTVPQSAAEQMERLLPRGSLLVIKGEPHCVHYTAPQVVCAAIEKHAAQLERRSHEAAGFQPTHSADVLERRRG